MSRESTKNTVLPQIDTVDHQIAAVLNELQQIADGRDKVARLIDRAKKLPNK